MKLCLRCNQYFEDGIELCPIDTSQLEAVGDHPLIGALINDRYVVDSVIGKGSTGIVYKATRLLMGSEVAVKVLHSYLGAEAGALDRFLREARAASRLRHPHIINIWEFGATDDGQPYFVMDYLEGMTLADLIRQKGFLHPMKMLPIIKQVCEALTEAHKQNIIHRDIKPENIVLQETDYAQGQDFVKVLDFGIADQPASAPGQKRSKMAAGSPAYMSPEQCQGFELDARTDVYSLGIVVFEMLTGQRPFTAEDVMNLFYQHVSKAPPTMSSVRPDLKFAPQVEAVVAKALAKKPAQRYQTIKDFCKELEDAYGTNEKTRKTDSMAMDMYALPMGEMLTDGLTMPAAGMAPGAKTKGNFLPGPEDMLYEDQDTLVPGAAASKPAAETADHTPIPPKPAPAHAQQDYQDAVSRLLKSAKRASEPPPATPAGTSGPNDVSSWAREVLTRSGEQPKPPGDQPKTPIGEAPKAWQPPKSSDLPKADDVRAKDAPTTPRETFKSTTRSSGSHPAHPPLDKAGAASASDAARGRAPEAPDVNSWAQRVLSRSTSENATTDSSVSMPAVTDSQDVTVPLDKVPPSTSGALHEGTKKTSDEAAASSAPLEQAPAAMAPTAQSSSISSTSDVPPVPSTPAGAAAPQNDLVKPTDFLLSKAKQAAELKAAAEANGGKDQAGSAATPNMVPRPGTSNFDPDDLDSTAAQLHAAAQKISRAAAQSPAGTSKQDLPAAGSAPNTVSPQRNTPSNFSTTSSSSHPTFSPADAPAARAGSGNAAGTPSGNAAGTNSGNAAGMNPPLAKSGSSATPAQPGTMGNQPGATPSRDAGTSARDAATPSRDSSTPSPDAAPKMPARPQSQAPSPAASAEPAAKPTPPASETAKGDAAAGGKSTGLSMAAERLMGAFNKDKKHPLVPPTPAEPAAESPAAKGADAPKSAASYQNTPGHDAAAAAAARQAAGADPNDENSEYYQRFEQPVNKGNESVSSFANAVGALLDAAILPKKPGDTGHRVPSHTKSSESPVLQNKAEGRPGEAAKADAKADPKQDIKPETKPEAKAPPKPEPKAPDAKPVSKPEMKKPEPASATQSASRPAFDPKRFDEPVNRGSLGETRFDAEVNRALRPVSEHSLPALDPLDFPQSPAAKSSAGTTAGAAAAPSSNTASGASSAKGGVPANSLEARLAAAASASASPAKESPRTTGQGKEPPKLSTQKSFDKPAKASDKSAKSFDQSGRSWDQTASTEAEPLQSAASAAKPQQSAKPSPSISSVKTAAMQSAESAAAANSAAAAAASSAAASSAAANASANATAGAQSAMPSAPTNPAAYSSSEPRPFQTNEALTPIEFEEPFGNNDFGNNSQFSHSPFDVSPPSWEESHPGHSFANTSATNFEPVTEVHSAETSSVAPQFGAHSSAAASDPSYDEAPNSVAPSSLDASVSEYGSSSFATASGSQPNAFHEEPHFGTESHEQSNMAPDSVPHQEFVDAEIVAPNSIPVETASSQSLEPAQSAAQPFSDIPTAPAFDISRFDQPINNGALDATTADQPATDIAMPTAVQDTDRPALDRSRFDQPVNQGSEKLNTLAQAVDGAIDSALAKKPVAADHQAPMDVPIIGQTETGMIDSARLKAKVASLKAGLANQAQPPAPPPAPEDKMSDAVSRLIEAAQKAPDSATASTTSAKPEALNRKIEAVKKKIEALKAGQQPGAEASVQDQRISGITPATPRPVQPAPLNADPGSVSDAVNRLLEAAQSGVYPTVGNKTPNPRASQNIRVSDTGMQEVRRSGSDAVPPPAVPTDAAGRAAAELAAMKAARAEVPDYYAGFKQVEKLDKATLAQQRKKDRARLRSVAPGVPWVKLLLYSVIALAVAGAVYFVTQQNPAHKTNKAPTVEEMVKQGDYEGAVKALEKNTKRTPAEQTKLYEIYFDYAKQQADDGNFQSAVQTLRKIPRRSPLGKQSKKLITQYLQKQK